MIEKTAADLIVVFHFVFILFVMAGAFLVLRWRWIIWLHMPCAIWGALVEFTGWICPLTPWENSLRISAGSSGYNDGFVEHYILPVIYPAELTKEIQLLFGSMVIAVNVLTYFLIWKKRKKKIVL